ncbi:MAG TPA: hypothetical protein ENI27_01455 [bacterium]|nr:hypothetical protein [bacterium]
MKNPEALVKQLRVCHKKFKQVQLRLGYIHDCISDSVQVEQTMELTENTIEAMDAILTQMEKKD